MGFNRPVENGALKSTKDLFIKKKKKLNQMQLFPKWLGMFMHAQVAGSSFQNCCAKDVAAKLMKFITLIKHVSNMFLHIPKFLIQPAIIELI